MQKGFIKERTAISVLVNLKKNNVVFVDPNHPEAEKILLKNQMGPIIFLNDGTAKTRGITDKIFAKAKATDLQKYSYSNLSAKKSASEIFETAAEYAHSAGTKIVIVSASCKKSVETEIGANCPQNGSYSGVFYRSRETHLTLHHKE